MLSNKISQPTLPLSGKSLFFLLLIGLTSAALPLDRSSGQSSSLLTSLTLPLRFSGLVTAGVGYWVVPLLRALKMGQFIHEDGPPSFKKAVPRQWGNFSSRWPCALSAAWAGVATRWGPPQGCWGDPLTFAYGVIGWLDDWQVLRYRSNRGIPPRLRLGLEVVCGVLFCAWLAWSQPEITTLSFSFGWALPLGLLFWPLAIFVGAAESNAINLTDGLDGLAAGTQCDRLLGFRGIHCPHLA